MSTLQPVTPARLDEIVTTCLAKNPDDRWQGAGDIGRQLKGISESGSQTNVAAIAVVPGTTGSRPVVPWVAAVALTVATGVVVWSVMRPGPSPPRPLAQFEINTPVDGPVMLGYDNRELALSPDGTTMAYGSDAEGQGLGVGIRLFTHPIGQLGATPLTEPGDSPFFSPDGQQIGFVLRTRGRPTLMWISVLGGPAQAIGGESDLGASWGPDETIVLGARRDSG
jgi:hypothetical protein